MMKQVKDFKALLNEIEPYIKDGRYLTQGVKFPNFNMLVREIWGNWLLCVVLQKVTADPYTFAETVDNDGVVINKRDSSWFLVEHVCAMNFPGGEQLPKGEDRVIWAIDHKINRGEEYARGKTLVVFFDGAGNFSRQKIRENISGRHGFDCIYCIRLLKIDEKGYSYVITAYSPDHPESSLSYVVTINIGFTDWEIVQI